MSATFFPKKKAKTFIPREKKNESLPFQSLGKWSVVHPQREKQPLERTLLVREHHRDEQCHDRPVVSLIVRERGEGFH